MTYNSIGIAAWLLQTLLVVLVCAGFNGYYHHLWRTAFIQESKRGASTGLTRLVMFIISAGTGLAAIAGIHFGVLHFGTAMLLATALFALTLPLLNTRLNLFEFGGQLLAIAAGTGILYWDHLTVRPLITFVLAAIIAIVAFALRTKLASHIWAVIVVFAATGIAFVAPLPLAPVALAQIFGAYLVGFVCTSLLWNATIEEDSAVTEHTVAEVARTQKPDAAPKHEYAFFVQKMVDATGDEIRIMAYELLLREWNESEQRWGVPSNFDIPIDQQIELMKNVLAKTGNARLSLNLSAQQFVDAHTAQALVAFAQNYDQLDGMIIELTHAPSLADMRRISPLYHQADIRIAIYGVGSDNHFESLQGVFPYIDGLKFALQKLRKDQDMNNLDERLGFWYDLAAEYDIDFIMEGIENQDDVDYVENKLHVQYLQGYMYGRPDLPENYRDNSNN